MSESGGLVFTQDYRIRYHDCEPDQRLSVAGLLRYFEEIALLQSDELGVGFDYYDDRDVTWILSRWDVRIHSLPALGDRITALTQPARYRGFKADRRFEINARDGTRHVDARSRWIFLDTSRMRPRRVPPELAAVYGMSSADGAMPWEAEPVDPEGGEAGLPLEVRAGDIDMNGHLNNIRYVEWALQARPDETRRLARLLVAYQGEALLGASLRIVTQEADGIAWQRIEEGERTAALVTTHWL